MRIPNLFMLFFNEIVFFNKIICKIYLNISYKIYMNIFYISGQIYSANYNKYAIHAYTHGPVTGSGPSVSLVPSLVWL